MSGDEPIPSMRQIGELVEILLDAGLAPDRVPRFRIDLAEADGRLKIDWDRVPEGGLEGGPSWAHLIEAAARTISVRSARSRPDGIRPYPQGWRETLRRIWAPWLDCELSVDQGWGDLLIAMLDQVSEADPDERFTFTQNKEQFGGLRAYSSAMTDELQDVLSSYEALSYHVCETCGAPGKLRQGSWRRTLCDRHAGEER